MFMGLTSKSKLRFHYFPQIPVALLGALISDKNVGRDWGVPPQ